MIKYIEEKFSILIKIQKNFKASQRLLVKDLAFSLGKINYCLKSQKNKVFIKIQNFSKKKDKLKYFKQYVITPKDILKRTILTIKFMKKKIREYDELKKELA